MKSPQHLLLWLWDVEEGKRIFGSAIIADGCTFIAHHIPLVFAITIAITTATLISINRNNKSSPHTRTDKISYLGDKKKIQPTSVVATTTACHLQHKLPTELVQLIFSHIHPSHAFKYRRLCRRIDACLSSTSFVALNLDRFVTLATPPPLSTPSSPPAAVAAAAKQMVFESCEYTAYFHRMYFKWPRIYQREYTRRVLVNLQKISWTDDRARRLFLFRSGGGRGGLVGNHPQIQREIPSSTRKGISMIPNSLGMITTLKYLKLNHLGLTGRFADAVTFTLGKLCNLETLSLCHNNLHGPLPNEISTLSALRILDLGFNMLSGAIPVELYTSLGHLRTLKLNNNSFSGGLVPEIRCLRNLERLDLGHNSLVGDIPQEIGTCLHGLYFMDLSNNHFSREIPCELGNLSDLRFLFLQNNQLTGTVPVELGRLRNIDMVSVKGNLVSLPKLRAVDGGRAVVWYILQRELNYKA